MKLFQSSISKVCNLQENKNVNNIEISEHSFHHISNRTKKVIN